MNGSSHGSASSHEPLALDLSSLSSRSAPSTSRGGSSKRTTLKRRSSQGKPMFPISIELLEDEHRQSPRRDFRNGNSASHPPEEPMELGAECTNGKSATNGCPVSSTTIITEPVDDAEENGGKILPVTPSISPSRHIRHNHRRSPPASTTPRCTKWLL